MGFGTATAAGALAGPIGLGIGAAVDIGKLIFGAHQNHLANQIHPVFNPYTTSPYAKAQLGTAQSLFNAPMAGAAEEARNIQTAQANTSAGIQRNATDSSQALLLNQQSQGIANNAYSDLQVKTAQNKYSLLSNLNSAYGAMTNEGDKVYNSMLEKYGIDTQQQQQLRNSGAQNMFGAGSDLAAGFIKAGSLYGNKAQYGNPNYLGE